MIVAVVVSCGSTTTNNCRIVYSVVKQYCGGLKNSHDVAAIEGRCFYSLK